MKNKLKDKLKSEIDQADWSMLKVHHDNGALFVVSNKLNLVDVAAAVALDEVNLVKIWLENGDLRRLEDNHVKEFEKNQQVKIGDVVIVQPYVLMKLFD